MTEPKFLGLKDVAAELGIGVDTAKGFIRDGVIPAIDVGRGSRNRWRVSRVDLDRWIESRRAAVKGGDAA